MSTQPLKLIIGRSDKGLVTGKTKGGIDAPVWREEFVVDVKGRFLFGRCDVPDGGYSPQDLASQRVTEAIATLKLMGEQIGKELGKNVELKIEEDPLGQGLLTYFECTTRPLSGVELILVRGLANLIHQQHPKWKREKVNEVLAFARVGKGPYAGEWTRMNARGPGFKLVEPDPDDAPAFGS